MRKIMRAVSCGQLLLVSLSLLAFSPLITPALADLNEDLVVHYTFDADTGTNVWDSSGNGNHAFTVGAVRSENSIFGKAARCSSWTTWIESSATGLCANGWAGVTVSLWMNKKVPTLYGHIIDRGGGKASSNVGAFELCATDYCGSALVMRTNSPTGLINVNVSNFPPAGTPKMALNRWYHLVGMYDGSSVKYYVDGVLMSSTAVFPANQPLYDSISNRLVIGNCGRQPYIDWVEMYTDGLFDEVRIYKRALSEGEILSLYTSGSGPTATLLVQGDPAQYGSPSPQGYGSNLVLVSSMISNAVVSPVSGGAGIRYVCEGWTGTGDVEPASGSGTCVGFAVTTNSTLTWKWRKEYFLDTSAGPNGTIDVPDAWHTNGSVVTITANPATDCRFNMWLGNVPPGDVTKNPLTVTMDQARGITACFASSAGSSLTNGLVVHYTFDADTGTNVWDSSGNGNHAFTVGAVRSEDSIFGKAARCSSWTTWIESSATGLCANGWAGVTVSLWMNKKVPTLYGHIIDRGGGKATSDTGAFELCATDYCGSALVMRTNSPSGLINVNVSNFPPAGTPKMALNRWYHLVGMYDGSSVKYYVDGVLMSSTAVFPANQPLYDSISNRLVIGNCGRQPYIDWVEMYTDGLFDEVRIYKRALSDGEILSLYTSGSGPSARLVVQGDPMRYGSPQPYGYGTNAAVPIGRTVTNTVSSPVSGGAGVRYICEGWTGTGDVPSTGSGTSAVFTVSTNSTLTWKWRKECFLDISAGANGTIDVTDAWYTNGSVVTITATPSNGYVFAIWSGNIPQGQEAGNPLTVIMDRARTVTACFAWADPATLEQDLVVHYTFDADTGTNVWDTSGNGNHAYLVGAVTHEDALFGKAARFTTWTTWVESSSTGLCANGWSGLTFSVWVNKTAPTLYGHIIDRGGGRATSDTGAFELCATDYCGSALAMRTNSPTGVVNVNVSNFPPGGTPAMALNRWYHLAGVYDGSNVNYYVDGALMSSTPVFPVNQPVYDSISNKLVIGNCGRQPYIDWVEMYHSGLIDEVRIYKRGLSAGEVVGLYVSGSGATASLTVDGSPARHGLSVPYGYGTNSSLLAGKTVTNTVSSPVSGAAGIRYVCEGWTGTGDVPFNGSSPSVAFTVTTNSTLTWKWRTEYFLDADSTGGGSVDISDNWFTNGQVVAINATPFSGCSFSSWSGDVPAGHETDSSLIVTMDQARSIVAHFTASTYALHGQIFYTGQQTGTVRVEAFTNASCINRFAFTDISAPGSYTLTGLEGGKDYWIRAYVDVNNSGTLNTMEPVGSYPMNPILSLASGTEGIDIRLQRVTAPQGLTACGAIGSIALRWNPNQEPGIAGYNVYRFDQEWCQFEKLNSAPIAGSSFTDSVVDEGQIYYYYITAVVLSPYLSDYQESPASAIVSGISGAITLWMPDYCGIAGSTVRARINASDLDKVAGKDLTIEVSYNTNVLTPITQVDADKATVEVTALTESLAITDNGATATGRVTFTASDPLAGTRNALLRILGCAYESSPRRPAAIVGSFSTNSGTGWESLVDGRNLNDGLPHSVDLGSMADGTNCIVSLTEAIGGRTYRSDDGSGHVIVLRDGDSFTNMPGMRSQEDLSYYLRPYAGDDLVVHIGSNDVIYLFELGGSLHGASADYQDAVIYVEFNDGRGLKGCGHLFDVVFQVNPGVTLGTKATNAFVSAVLKDVDGRLIGADISDVAIFTAQSNYILGDINNDGVVDVPGDFTLAMKIAVGHLTATELQLMAGDIDGDGAITKSDATLIHRIAQGLSVNPEKGGSAGASKGSYTLLGAETTGYGLSIGTFNVQPGDLVQVPVLIDNAEHVANIRLRINYDSALFVLMAVTNAPLTVDLTCEYKASAGYVEIVLAGPEAISGDGPIAYLTFYCYADASAGFSSDITISDLRLGNEFGKDLGLTSGMSIGNGLVGVVETEILSIVKASVSEGQAGFRLDWPTTWGNLYVVESCTNLLDQFRPVASNFIGNGTTKSFTDTNDYGDVGVYYRIRIDP